MMRVLFFDHVATLSGGEIALANLLRSLDRAKVEPVVVLAEEGPLLSRLPLDVEVHVLPLQSNIRNARKDNLGGGGMQPQALLGSIRYVQQLAALFKKSRADLVHTNSLKSDLLGGFAAKLARLPVVWHVRDRIADDYLPPRVVGIFREMAARIPDLVLTNSHATAATLPKVKAERMRVVHDGVVVEDFASLVQDHPPFADLNAPVVGLVGRISPWKGQDIFVRAAKLLRTRFPSARFRIIGAPLFEEREYEQELHRLVRELGLEDTVTFTGFHHDMSAALAEVDVLVHASTRPEPFGQVIIEGMAAGRPVVAVDAGGVPEIVQDGVTGLLVKRNDPEDLARAVGSLLADPAAARAMALRGYSHVGENFSISRTAAGVSEAFSLVMQRRHARKK